jgi:DMSO reductase anchor subunit
MHPAPSVIFFTVASGAGLGLLFWFAVAQGLGPLPLSREIALLPLGAGMLLLAIGLASAFLHLGRPGRAWRAASQWRTSWLSREAVAAALVFAASIAMAWLVWQGPAGPRLALAAAALAALAIGTVYTTAGIYFSLRPVPAWSNALVAPGFLLAAVLSGAALFWLLLSIAMWRPGRGEALAFSAAAIAYALLKLAYWRHVDRHGDAVDTGAATGLRRFGAVRSAEAPHSEANYLLREMGFVFARRHGRRLRAAVVLLAGALPALCGTAALGGHAGPSTAGLACVSMAFGLLCERWLFFAEARHVVVAYYR